MRYVGIDAGGTRTRIIVVQEDDLRANDTPAAIEHILGPGNFRHLEEDGLRELAVQAADRIGNPGDTRLLAGFAGAGTPQSQSVIRLAFQDAGFSKVTVTSDAGLMLLGMRNHGIVLIAGTGSICLGRKPPAGSPGTFDEARSGGYGYRSVSEPGGYFLGIHAVEAALRIADGRSQESTILTDLVRDHFELTDLQQIVPVLYPDHADTGSVQAQIADVAPGVLAAAAGGDAVAQGIVSRAVDGMADHICAVYQRLDFRCADVGLHGGLFAAPESASLLVDPLTSHAHLQGCTLIFRSFSTGHADPLVEALRFHLTST